MVTPTHVCVSIMASATARIAAHTYTGGRGRGILGIERSKHSRPSGARTDTITSRGKTSNSQQSNSTKQAAERSGDVKKISSAKVLVACFDYKANQNNPAGFTELSLSKGQMLDYLSEHPVHEQWWEARNEDGEIGFVPSSYVIEKEDQILPWLQKTSLEEKEKERKARALRQKQQQDFSEGKGFGPPPTEQKPYVYVSAYNREGQVKKSGSEYYCDICDKGFNGPKPYRAHMMSRAHKEEVEIRNEYP